MTEHTSRPSHIGPLYDWGISSFCQELRTAAGNLRMKAKGCEVAAKALEATADAIEDSSTAQGGFTFERSRSHPRQHRCIAKAPHGI